MQNSERQDIYTRITAKIVASLEQGVRPWMKPWSGDNAAARISRPLRHNGQPYSGINILMLWGASVENGFASPTWMTFKQALELDTYVRKGEKGSLVVYANTFTRTEKDADGLETDREIPFLKGYTVFNVDQIDGLPEHYYAQARAEVYQHSTHRTRRCILRRDESRHPVSRRPSLLRAGGRLHSNAAHRELSRCRIVCGYASPRKYPSHETSITAES
jgi:antirestriction protein ArdC